MPFQAELVLSASHVFCLQLLLPARSEKKAVLYVRGAEQPAYCQMQSVGCFCQKLLSRIPVSFLGIIRVYIAAWL